MRVYQSTEELRFAEVAAVAGGAADLAPGAVVTADFKGFGACFNELGWRALGQLDQGKRASVLNALFSEAGLGFNYCRVPIGANDYSTSWYSHNEVEGDFAMERFSIDRDRRDLLPFLRAAQAVRGRAFTLMASPWSPPTWMKFPQAHNHGRLIWDKAHRAAYALYLTRFVQAYEAEGVHIDALHVQNEPDSDQKFPSCCWTGETLRDFIRDDLAPAFAAAGVSTGIWLGTIERGSFNDWVAPSVYDPEVRRVLKGVGFQWAGKAAVQRVRQAVPDLALIQTENECGDGENSWAYAHYVFDLMQHYLSNGAEAYLYWNMVLGPKGRSTWGWTQNSLFTVQDGEVVENPEYHLLRHVAGFVRAGAQVLAPVGPWAANALYFRNADGREVCVVQNPLAGAVELGLCVGGVTSRVVLPGRSFTTVVA